MSKDTDSFGNRMKDYEQAEAGRKALPLLPIMIRLDGKGFSKWTKGLKRPYDPALSAIMVETTKYLIEYFGACCGYTQSDEISMVLYSDDYNKEVYYNGKFQKLASVTASVATGYFNNQSLLIWPEKPLAFFDSRVWTVPTLEEASNAFLWREQDATKNSISMAARHYYSHKELHGKNGSEMQEMLHQKGVNWNNYPAFFKRGTFVRKKKELTKFTTDELSRLPENHQARSNPDLMIERSIFVSEEMPKFSSVTNRVGVIFYGEEPLIQEMISDKQGEM